MSKKEKLIKRLKSKPRDMSYHEIETLLISLGFWLSNTGKTSGSAVLFDNGYIKIRFHKPHGGRAFKMYQLRDIMDELINGGLI
ncbi:MAG: type II toxin-antitoxin system HicA family toxin [Defluviitaleaceae bacterium]|nr:type II toxin-antitoxin system HicA family toxin [Defluviitaleaceae bacterium]